MSIKDRLLFLVGFAAIRLLRWSVRIDYAVQRPESKALHPVKLTEFLTSAGIDPKQSDSRQPDSQQSNAQRPVCFALWHENWLGALLGMANLGCAPLVSRSRDGSLLTAVLERVGFFPVRGSSSKGGSEGKHSLIETTRGGKSPLITVDGPTGPARKAKFGIASVAVATQLPIVPIHITFSSYWRLGSWDKMFVPKPFSRLTVSHGELVDFHLQASDSHTGSSSTSEEEKKALYRTLVHQTETRLLEMT